MLSVVSYSSLIGGSLLGLSGFTGVSGIIINGEVIIGEDEATVVGKFVYDYNSACFPPHVCAREEFPGLFGLKYKVTSADEKSPNSSVNTDKKEAQKKKSPTSTQEGNYVYLGLLDDEPSHFPKLFPTGENLVVGSLHKTVKSCADILGNVAGSWILLQQDDNNDSGRQESTGKTAQSGSEQDLQTCTWSPAYADTYLKGCIEGDDCKPYQTMGDAKAACTKAGSKCGGIVGRPCDVKGSACGKHESKCQAFEFPPNHWEIRRGSIGVAAPEKSEDVSYVYNRRDNVFSTPNACQEIGECILGDACQKYPTRESAEIACRQYVECTGIVSRPCKDTGKDLVSGRECLNHAEIGKSSSSTHHRLEDIHHWEIRASTTPEGHTSEVTYVKHCHHVNMPALPELGKSIVESGDEIEWDTTNAFDRLESGELNPPHKFREFILQKCRRRVWRFVLMGCGQELKKVQFSIHAINRLNGFEKELGADENGLEVWTLLMALISTFMSLSLFVFDHDSRNMNSSLLHTAFMRKFQIANRRLGDVFYVTKLSSYLFCVGSNLRLIDYVGYIYTGSNSSALGLTGRQCENLCRGCLFLILFFLASDSPTSIYKRGMQKIHGKGGCSNVKSTGMQYEDSDALSDVVQQTGYGHYIKYICAVSTVSLVLLEEWAQFEHLSTLSTVSKYDTLPGLILIVLDLLLTVTLFFLMQFSYIRDPHYRSRFFYIRWGFPILLYFLCIPGVSMIAYCIDPWVRKRVVYILASSGLLYGVAIANYLLFPEVVFRSRISNAIYRWIFPKKDKMDLVNEDEFTNCGIYSYMSSDPNHDSFFSDEEDKVELIGNFRNDEDLAKDWEY